MNLIISVIIFIIVFAIIRDIIFYIENRWLNIKPLTSMNGNLKFGIKFIGLLIIMFISFKIINFTNPFVEGAFIGAVLAIYYCTIEILVNNKKKK